MKLVKNKRPLSKYKGVGWDFNAQKFRASVCINKKRFHIGMYDNDKKAAEGIQDFIAGLEAWIINFQKG